MLALGGLLKLAALLGVGPWNCPRRVWAFLPRATGFPWVLLVPMTHKLIDDIYPQGTKTHVDVPEFTTQKAYFGAVCLDVRTLTFCQRTGFCH